jgi:HAD superfamily hydrolase (TIGR01509 family)
MNLKLSQNIKTIIFDLGKVIVNFDHFIICGKLAENSPFPADKIYEKIFTSGLEEQFDMGIISPDSFFEAASSKLELHMSEEMFREIWENIFSLNTDIEPLIYALKKKYRLLCLSNTNQWHFEFCMQHFSVLKNFDSFILSYETGQKKPDKLIYSRLLEQADALPQECVYIDDIKEFVEVAEEIGIHGIHFLSVKQTESDLKSLGVL